MGEYYLECGPEETKTELKEVIQFIEHPVFTSSIINGDHVKYMIIIGLLLGAIIAGNFAYSSSHNYMKIGFGFLSLICFFGFILIGADIF